MSFLPYSMLTHNSEVSRPLVVPCKMLMDKQTAAGARLATWSVNNRFPGCPETNLEKSVSDYNPAVGKPALSWGVYSEGVFLASQIPPTLRYAHPLGPLILKVISNKRSR